MPPILSEALHVSALRQLRRLRDRVDRFRQDTALVRQRMLARVSGQVALRDDTDESATFVDDGHAPHLAARHARESPKC
jgi:hypothetical protein